jgi:NAD(P)-dependent dehydrogenase (short-subunit alcohol dehydrogenase family)
MTSEARTALIVGGTTGIGLEVARKLAADGVTVLITGREAGRASRAAASAGPSVSGIALDLTSPHQIGAALADLPGIDYLVLAAIERDDNAVASYDVDRAIRLTTLKLVGYTEVVHAVAPRMGRDGSIVLFGGLAKDRPYPGSTTVSTINGGVTGLVHTLAAELAPIRVNAVHPGIVGDSPFWSAKPAAVLDPIIARTPTGRLARMNDVADAVLFLLRNPSVNGVGLNVDGGWMLR